MAVDFKLLNALTKARKVYGDNYLIDLAIEEMGELIVAINHHRRKRVEEKAVQEEIADVMLALKELQQIFGTGDVIDLYRVKCERFEQRVDNDEKKEGRQHRQVVSAQAQREQAKDSEVQELSAVVLARPYNAQEDTLSSVC